MTLNVLEMDIEPDANGTLEIYDSCEFRPDKLIARFTVVNNTLPMGVSSTHDCMFVRFTWMLPDHVCATQKDCVKFAILVDTSPEPGDIFSLLIQFLTSFHFFFLPVFISTTYSKVYYPLFVVAQWR